MNRQVGLFCNGWWWSLTALWAGLLFVYVLSAPPDITFEDTALFAGACATLGLPQPPGYPLYVFSCLPLTWLFGILDFPPALGAAVTSAVAAATACLVLALLLRRVTGSRIGALLAAGLLGLAPSYWDQAQIPEVYTLNVLLLMICWYICQRLVEEYSRHWVQILALIAGLGLANHWPLFMIAFPALLFWLGPVWPRLLREVRDVHFTLTCLALFIVGLLPYLHLLFIGPGAYLFDPNYQATDFLSYVRRDAYGVGGETLSLSVRLGSALGSALWFVGEYAYLFGFAVVAGLGLLWVRRHYCQLLAMVWGMLSSTTFLALARPFDQADILGIWIFHVYPLPAYAFAALPLAVTIQWLLSRYRLHFASEVSLAVVCLVAVALWRFPEADRRTDILATWQARLVLEKVPDGALFLKVPTDYNFPLTYVEVFTKPRPDMEFRFVHELFTNMTKSGEIELSDEENLRAQDRPVVFSVNLKLRTLGKRYHGTHQSLDESVPAGLVAVDLDAAAREYIGHVYEMRQQGIRNVFTKKFAEVVITNYVFVVESARLRGDALVAEDLDLLRLLVATPEGQFAKFTSFILASPTPPSLSQVEIAAKEVEPYMAAMPAENRSDILRLVALARIISGQLASGRVLLERALTEYPSASNASVLVDLLQVLSEQGEFEEYLRLRQAYPALDAGTALIGYDARCEARLLRPCQSSLQ